jgi:hypothetical protein
VRHETLLVCRLAARGDHGRCARQPRRAACTASRCPWLRRGAGLIAEGPVRLAPAPRFSVPGSQVEDCPVPRWHGRSHGVVVQQMRPRASRQHLWQQLCYIRRSVPSLRSDCALRRAVSGPCRAVCVCGGAPADRCSVAPEPEPRTWPARQGGRRLGRSLAGEAAGAAPGRRCRSRLPRRRSRTGGFCARPAATTIRPWVRSRARSILP